MSDYDPANELELLALSRGRPKAPSPFGQTRPLTIHDLESLRNRETIPPPANQISQIRHRHHYIARLIAEGRKHTEVSAITGMSQSRISLLLDDPAFNELVSYYKTAVQDQYTEAHQKLAQLGISTVEELQDRFDANPGQFSTKDLVELTEMAMDRSVAPSKGAGKGGPQGAGAGNFTIAVQFVQPAGQNPAILPQSGASESQKPLDSPCITDAVVITDVE